MKNHTDVLIFHTAFCAEASQKSLDATTEIAYANFCCAIPTLRFGMEISMDNQKYIKIRGAAEHNLKELNVDIPRNKFVVLTGLSGSGKSSHA